MDLPTKYIATAHCVFTGFIPPKPCLFPIVLPPGWKNPPSPTKNPKSAKMVNFGIYRNCTLKIPVPAGIPVNSLNPVLAGTGLASEKSGSDLTGTGFALKNSGSG